MFVMIGAAINKMLLKLFHPVIYLRYTNDTHEYGRIYESNNYKVSP